MNLSCHNEFSSSNIILYINAGDKLVAEIQWIYIDDWLLAAYLGLIQAFGDAAFTYLIKYFPALAIPVFMNFQPIIELFIGWCAGVEGILSIYTWIRGFIVIIGNIIVTLLSTKTKKQIK